MNTYFVSLTYTKEFIDSDVQAESEEEAIQIVKNWIATECTNGNFRDEFVCTEEYAELNSK